MLMKPFRVVRIEQEIADVVPIAERRSYLLPMILIHLKDNIFLHNSLVRAAFSEGTLSNPSAVGEQKSISSSVSNFLP
jgi:hypothetical protein